MLGSPRMQMSTIKASVEQYYVCPPYFLLECPCFQFSLVQFKSVTSWASFYRPLTRKNLQRETKRIGIMEEGELHFGWESD
jgi:hypothetical protein